MVGKDAIHDRMPTRDQRNQRAVSFHHVIEIPQRFLVHRLSQSGSEGGKTFAVDTVEFLKLPDTKPLPEKFCPQSLRPRVPQHPLDLRPEDLGP